MVKKITVDKGLTPLTYQALQSVCVCEKTITKETIYERNNYKKTITKFYEKTITVAKWLTPLTYQALQSVSVSERCGPMQGRVFAHTIVKRIDAEPTRNELTNTAKAGMRKGNNTR